MKPKVNGYKVKDLTTGLFMIGGTGGPRWTKKGKMWLTLGSLRIHLRDTCRYGNCSIMPTWEVVEIYFTEGEKFPASSLVLKRQMDS